MSQSRGIHVDNTEKLDQNPLADADKHKMRKEMNVIAV